MDAAGQNATKRALQIAASVGLKLRVVHLGEGKDPDEFVNLHGGDAYLEAVNQAEPAMDFLFHSLLKTYDSTTLDGQHHILDEMFSILLDAGDAFQLNSFIKKMARTMHMDEGMIRSEALIYARKNKSNVYISQKVPVEQETVQVNPLQKKQRLLEGGLLKYCLHYHRLPEGLEELGSYKFADDFYGRLFEICKEIGANGAPITEEAVEGRLSREDVEKLGRLLMDGDQPGSIPKEEYIWPMKKIYLQEEYRIHTQRAQELLMSDPEKAKEEQLLCIRLSKEILALGRG